MRQEQFVVRIQRDSLYFCQIEKSKSLLISSLNGYISRSYLFYVSANLTPFNIQFITDQIEMQNEALVDNNATPKTGSGFQLAYFMTTNKCD